MTWFRKSKQTEQPAPNIETTQGSPLVLTGPESHHVTIEQADLKTVEVITSSDLTRAAFTVYTGSDGHRYKLAMSQKLEYQGMYKLTFIQLPEEQ